MSTKYREMQQGINDVMGLIMLLEVKIYFKGIYKIKYKPS
jgi:hypothetical protein